MGIRNIQYQRAMKNIVQNYLLRGQYPRFETLTYHLSQWLREHPPGEPSFKPMPVFRHEVSSSRRYNQNLKEIHTDVSDVYQATKNQHEGLLTEFELEESWREKIKTRVKHIENQLDEILLTTDDADYRYFDSKTVSFHTMNQVSQSDTTAEINLQSQTMTLPINTKKSELVHLERSNTSFENLTPHTKEEALESINRAFDGHQNTAWWHVIKTEQLGANINDEDRAGEMRLALNIEFDQEEEINEVVFDSNQGNPVWIDLFYTMDGSTYHPIGSRVETIRIYQEQVWHFDMIRCKGIRFVMRKHQYDERSAGVYQYYFGARHIQVKRKHYLSEGVFYTKEIPFDDSIETVSMITKDKRPKGTDIEYEITLLDRQKNLFDHKWYKIKPINQTAGEGSQYINFNTKNFRQMESNKAEDIRLESNGMKLYRLVRSDGESLLGEEIINGERTETFDEVINPRLYRGVDQWKREATYLPFDGTLPTNQKMEDHLSREKRSVKEDFFDIGNNLSLETHRASDNFYRFSISVYSDEGRTIPFHLSMLSTIRGREKKRVGSWTIYLNNKRHVPRNEETTLELDQGWNEILVLVHIGDYEKRSDLHEHERPSQIHIGRHNFRRERIARGELNPMTFVGVDELVQNIPWADNSYFAIYQRQILLTYFPEDINFKLVYEANQREKTDHHTLLLRGRLTREMNDDSVTPEIEKVVIRAK